MLTLVICVIGGCIIFSLGFLAGVIYSTGAEQRSWDCECGGKEEETE